MAAASSISFLYCSKRASSTWAVGGARAGAATNSYIDSQSAHCHDILELHVNGNTNQGGVANELAGEPQEGLLEVVVGLGGDVVVLEVLLSVEGDGLGLNLSLLHINLVTAQDDGDVLANADKITCNHELVPLSNTVYV